LRSRFFPTQQYAGSVGFSHLQTMIYIFLALLAGTILPVQAAINAALRGQLGHPVLASFASFLIGTCCLGLYALVARIPFSTGNFAGIEGWKWTGGVLGAVYLTLAIILTPRLGAAVTFGLVITGQLIASVVLDHFGWLGIPIHQINAPRVLGVLLLMAGVVLVRNY
jgi:transporter family-2 protein